MRRGSDSRDDDRESTEAERITLGENGFQPRTAKIARMLRVSFNTCQANVNRLKWATSRRLSGAHMLESLIARHEVPRLCV